MSNVYLKNTYDCLYLFHALYCTGRDGQEVLTKLPFRKQQNGDAVESQRGDSVA